MIKYSEQTVTITIKKKSLMDLIPASVVAGFSNKLKIVGRSSPGK